MLGRIRRTGPINPMHRGIKFAESDRWILWAGGGLIVAGAAAWVFRGRRKLAARRAESSDRSDELDAFLSGSTSGRPPGDIDSNGLTVESLPFEADRR